MLIRTAALTLLAANALYFGWSQGLLAPLGLGPASSSEPQRLEQQIRPEALRVTPSAAPAEAAPGPSAPVAPTTPATPATPATPVAAPTPSTATSCLQAGPFDPAQGEALRQALRGASLPDGSWTLESTAVPSRWIVYMGKFTEADALEKKRAELRALRVETAPITQPSLAPGLSLGVFSSNAGAQEHLAQLTRRGVRTARVVPEQTDNTATQLRLSAADDGLRAQVQPLISKPLTPC